MFGPKKTTKESKAKTPSSSSDAAVRKPFVSTTKSTKLFGDPKPLPLTPKEIALAEKLKLESEMSSICESIALVESSEDVSPSTCMLLLQQSERWLNVSTCLWCIIVWNAKRSVDRDAVSSFIETMEWRLNDTITEEEFACMFAEWNGGVTGLHGTDETSDHGSKNQNANSNNPKTVVNNNNKHGHPCTIGVFGLRQVFLERHCTESRLDLYVCLLLYEVNRSLLNDPISFAVASPTGKGSRADAMGGGSSSSVFNTKPTLETCSKSWLAQSEELFFLLDSNGYGFLHFEDVYFLCECAAMGVYLGTGVAPKCGHNRHRTGSPSHNHSNNEHGEGGAGAGSGDPAEGEEDELDIAMSAQCLTALALQLMRDSGSKVNMHVHNRHELVRLALPTAPSGDNGNNNAEFGVNVNGSMYFSSCTDDTANVMPRNVVGAGGGSGATNGNATSSGGGSNTPTSGGGGALNRLSRRHSHSTTASGLFGASGGVGGSSSNANNSSTPSAANAVTSPLSAVLHNSMSVNGLPTSPSPTAHTGGTSSGRYGQQSVGPIQCSLNSAKVLVMTLPMFKLLLLRKGVGDAQLRALLSFVRQCIAQLYEVLSDSNATELMVTMRQRSTEDGAGADGGSEQLGAIISPKLWVHAVNRATATGILADTSGFTSSQDLNDSSGSFREGRGGESNEEGGNGSNALRKYLLSDADRQLCGLFYGYNVDIADLVLNPDRHESVVLHEKLLYPVSYKLYCSYQIWTNSGVKKDYNGVAFPPLDPQCMERLQNDPVFQVILAALIEFKSLQFQMYAAAYDMVQTKASVGASTSAAVMSTPSTPGSEDGVSSSRQQESQQDVMVTRACSMLLPAAMEVSKELATLVHDVAAQPKIHAVNQVSPRLHTASTFHGGSTSASSFAASSHAHDMQIVNTMMNASSLQSTVVSPSAAHPSAMASTETKDASAATQKSQLPPRSATVGASGTQNSVSFAKSSAKNKENAQENEPFDFGGMDDVSVNDFNAEWKPVFDAKSSGKSSTGKSKHKGKSGEGAGHAKNDPRKQASSGEIERVPNERSSKEEPVSWPQAESIQPLPAVAPNAAAATLPVPPAAPSSSESRSSASTPDAAIEAMLIDRLLLATTDAEREKILSTLRLLRSGSNGNGRGSGTEAASDAASPAAVATQSARPDAAPLQPLDVGRNENRTQHNAAENPLSVDQLRSNSNHNSKNENHDRDFNSANASPSSPPDFGNMRGMEDDEDDESVLSTLHGFSHAGGSEADSACGSAGSIADLLAQGQSAGVYAQSLREILRKMGRNSNKVQVKSLEAVLKLGYDIAQSEESTIAAIKNKRRNSGGGVASAGAHNNSGHASGSKPGPLHRQSSPQGPPGVAAAASASASATARAPSKPGHPQGSDAAPKVIDRFSAKNASPNAPVSGGSGAGAPIQRASMTKVPGHTPATSSNIGTNPNDNKGKFARLAKPPPVKAFGHPV